MVSLICKKIDFYKKDWWKEKGQVKKVNFLENYFFQKSVFAFDKDAITRVQQHLKQFEKKILKYNIC